MAHESLPICLPGKSSLLSALGNREITIPQHIDIFHLRREAAPTEKTALESVMEVDGERLRLEREAEDLATKESEGKYYIQLVEIVCDSLSLARPDLEGNTAVLLLD